jgi:hypothetical protein
MKMESSRAKKGSIEVISRQKESKEMLPDDGVPKIVKILRVPEGTLSLELRRQDQQYEIDSVKFHHDCIVSAEHHKIIIDHETARKAQCRVGENDVLVMTWYHSTLNKHPTNDLTWLGAQGRRILSALQYLHNFEVKKEEEEVFARKKKMVKKIQRG